MHRSLALTPFVGALTLGLFLHGGAARADDSPFVGQWHWNAKQSALPPGDEAPAAMESDISRADTAHMRWSMTVTDKHGKKDVETFDAPANGEFYPISNGTTASFRLADGAIDGLFKGPNGEKDALNCTLSADHNKMTCKGTITEKDGKTFPYTDVFDRK